MDFVTKKEEPDPQRIITLVDRGSGTLYAIL